MKKIINFNYKYDSSFDERTRLIKDVGFDGVFIYSQYNPNEYIESILKSGLEIETLHLPYKLIVDGKCLDSQFVNTIWTSKSDAEQYIADLIEQIQFASYYKIKNVVMHVTGGDAPPPISSLGVDRINRLVEHCEKKDINLCLENLRRLDYISYLFESIDSSCLKFCFDSGHANYMTKNIPNFPWQHFGDKLCCLHLNDNDSDHDSHSIPFSGNIEWASLMPTILNYNDNLNLTLEVRANQEQRDYVTEYDFLKKCFSSLVTLEHFKGS